jgi:glucose/arabinose dehydrogenase
MRSGIIILWAWLIPMAAAAGSVLPALSYQQQPLSIQGRTYSVQVPVGYRLELLTAALAEPRMLQFASNGDLFIGSKSGNVYRLPPPYTDATVLVQLSDYPHSVAFRAGEILIAQNHGLYRAAYQPGQRQIGRHDVQLLASLPGGRGHSSRTVAVGPDGRVYVSLGISGNCSDEYLGPDYDFGRQRGGVLVLDETGARLGWKVFASGLRNPVGFAWHPQTRVMYATNNGPDHQGFDLPPEYFSRIEAGSFHGMPWFQFDGNRLHRDDCVSSSPPRPITAVTTPAVTFPARNAPMAVAFVTPGALDERLTGDALVALRGSWGTRPKGQYWGEASSRRPPGIAVVRFDNGSARRVENLISGFQLADGERWARPVGVAIGPDGAVYFTSDSGINGLFRLRRDKP